MCAIAGIIELDHRRQVEPSSLLAMNKALAHRGPDDEGYLFINSRQAGHAEYCGVSSPGEIRRRLPLLGLNAGMSSFNIALSHRRFSIIDVSAAGHQPFVDRERRCCLIFNGEIYNYLELRDELEGKGVRFESQSDTEVLLEAYKYWGTDCFAKLNGFWAVALYDFAKKKLILSRDRLGKKPIYWTKIDSRIYFASEVKALLQIPEVHCRRRPHDEVIAHWLIFGVKDLNENSCFEGIFSLPPACWVVVDENFPNRTTAFWHLPAGRMAEAELSTEEAASRLRHILQEAVRIRLRADVPLSVELSGGLDSSALVALSTPLCSGKTTTYTVQFPEKQWNEEPFARLVAQRYPVDYQVLNSPTDNFWSNIRAFTYLEEEPYHSPNLQTNQVIWTCMRSRGTKVSLNGAGGDENFAGYGQYFGLAQTENLMRGNIGDYFRNIIHYSEARTGVRPLVLPFLRLAGRALADVLPPGFSRTKQKGFKLSGYSQLRTPITLSRALERDMTTALMPYWLRSGDRGYMGIPLEVRAPFLDHRVVDFAFALPATYLVRDGWHKWILRKAVEDLLPEDVVWRRRKLGFPFPYARFYAENAEILDIIFREADNPYLDLSRDTSLRHNWKALSFILWYELFFNENMSLFSKIEERARQITRAEEYGYTPEFLGAGA